eukprot:TRINITY_DN3045_c0_g1_i2.p2 TRINITY_DN3045_c0_g1~~TRINITY_DN3045_c0_g1_i2.p2  ORF type:complete len:156 (+),score=35.03 TRINITY_DN3045_c0_g1_i2:153-620(+)
MCSWPLIPKAPELVDTIWLLLTGKSVILLHWYHHISVMLFCWYAGEAALVAGIWFAAMNLVVHTVMYFYYFLTSLGFRPFWGEAITILQITQMVAGLVISASTWYFNNQSPQTCTHNKNLTLAGLGMYASYFVLFVMFFINRTSAPKTKKLTKKD